MFYGHMESATPGWEPALLNRMRFDPWEAHVQDGKLYGRAAYNMKSGNTFGIMALHAVVKAGVSLKGDVIFNFNTDEDVGSNGALARVLRGYTADAGINSEPSGLRICPAMGGPMWFRIEVTGRPALVGLGGGVSAIDKAIPIYEAVKQFGRDRLELPRHLLYERLENPAPLAVGVFRAGNWPSNLPQVAILEGRIGVMPGEDLPEIRRQFEAAIAKVADADEWMRGVPPEVTWTAEWGPAYTSPDHPIVTTTADVFREIKGSEPDISGKTAGMDMTKIATWGKVPSVNIGPAGGPFGQKLPTPELSRSEPFDEFVDLASFHDLTRLFALTILDWCGVADA